MFYGMYQLIPQKIFKWIFHIKFQNYMEEIIIQQCFFECRARHGKEVLPSWPDWLSYFAGSSKSHHEISISCICIFESLASIRYKNWCQMSGRLFAVFLDTIKTYCGFEQSIWGFSLPIFWALFNDISLEKTNNEISHCAACPEKMCQHFSKIAKNHQKVPNYLMTYLWKKPIMKYHTVLRVPRNLGPFFFCHRTGNPRSRQTTQLSDLCTSHRCIVIKSGPVKLYRLVFFSLLPHNF